MKEEREVKIYEFIKSNIINAVVILTSVAYVFYNMVVIEKTSLTIGEVIAKAGIGIIIGLMIKQGLGENGFNKGYSSHIWNDKMEKYSNACNLANPYMERVDNFYSCEIIEKKKKYRRQNLMGVRLKYTDYFDEMGNYIQDADTTKLDKKQKRMLNKCIKVRIYNLNLFGEYSNEIENDTHKEKTDKNQRAKMFGKNGLAQVLTAIVGAYFVPMLNGWSWASFIASSIQVCIWVFCGITQLYTNYNYIVVEKANKLTKKIELIIKFTKGCENNQYLTDPFDEV